ncbi:hypothetical protein HA402_010347 [Bradysia odoriphaga]|nr:hypothetical protein HA402_010347 [Bradysia odoriphaga]
MFIFRHSLAQQKSVEESIASSAPTPYHSPIAHRKLNSYNSSANSSGSETNVSRHGDRETSMRRQLLRRIWSKEFRQYTESRSGSWSPPMRRSQRRLHVELPDRCKECSKIEQACVLASPKRVRLNSSPIASTACVESKTNSANSNRFISSSDVHAPTTCSSETTDVTSTSESEAQHNTPDEHVLVGMDASSVDEHGADDGVTVVEEREESTVDGTQSTPSPSPSLNTNDTSDVVDSAYQNTTINDESINNSRIESEDQENGNVSSRNTNGHTTAETIEENGNDVEVVDQYVSALLVNSLNNLLDAVNEPTYITPNNNLLNRDSADYTTNGFQVNDNESNSVVSTINCEPIDTSKSSEYVERSPVNDELDDQNANTIHGVVDEERVIYFPHYVADCKDDESIYSTQLSEEDFLGSDTPNVIPVQSGSSYPNCDRNHGIIVSRSVHRTESMEAEPSSASPREDHGGNESDASLVDSLDEPISLNVERSNDAVPTTASPTIEKSQSFFVPIVDANQHIDEHIDVAAAMPEKLREKLAKRQLDMNTRKKLEINKKQKKIQKIIDRNQVGNEAVVEASDKSNKSKSSLTCSPSVPTKQDSRSSNSTAGHGKGSKHKFLRSEIGMLESYRIDSRGNMQFTAPPKSENGGSLVKKTPTSVKKPQPRKGDIITIKRSQTKKSTIDHNHRRKEVIKDVQHMTLYQAQPDLITPDTECGPRRMYQKTEIRDGDKRIEILEIVECVDSCSSADGSGSPHEITFRTTSGSLTRKSKIPVPVYKTGQSTGFQKSVKCATRDNVSPGKIFIKNIQQLGNNTKVDQMIADLLIEALNHPKEMGIEFVKSPKEFSRTGSGGGKRPLISRRNATGSRRSAGGTKYQQVFEVIPEEKGSFSVDSSAEDSNFSLSGQASNLLSESHATSARDLTSSSTKVSTADSKLKQNRIPRGKEAIESDILAEPEAWVGFFKQHDDSLVDSGNEVQLYFLPALDEENRNSNTSIDTKSSYHPKTVTVIETPCKTISHFQSPYTSSIFTPVSSADIFVSSSGSENILTVIDKTFAQSLHNDHFDTPKTIDSSERLICSECININEEIQRVELESEVKEPIESGVGKDEPATRTTDVEVVENVRNDVPSNSVQDENVWQVEDIKNYNSDQKKSPESRSVETVTPATNAEIDSTSFIVLRDDENEILKNTKMEEALPNSRDRCSDCCFCNPDLHRRDGASSAASCNFCNKRRESSKNRETGTKSTNTARAYESLSKSDHTHIRTKSKESDTVSLKCTRTSSRIRRFVPDDALNGNLCENVEEKSSKNRSTKPDLSKKPPKAPNISPARKVNTESMSPSHKPNARTTSGIRLPSPFVTAISSQSCDSTSSQCSSSSCSPGSPKKCPVLPSGRWQNSGGHQKPSSKIRASRYKDFYGDNDKKQVANKNDLGNIQSPNQNTGWSLTLAGTYNDDMAPDVEMRLSFPKKNGKTDSDTGSLNRKYSNSYKQENGNYQSFQREQSDVSNENYQLNNRAALPTAGNGNINPKRTLSKAVIDKNRNLRNYNLPDLSPFNGTIAQQTARKTIKRSEYSVAVASATRTISNYPNGKQQRAMSFQALNANAYRFDNRDRRRDHSVDLGHLSSRRMSIDSQTPSEAMALSILGNAIAPEQKPRVPTMSERDLTRKHNSCFTRNRSFFS